MDHEWLSNFAMGIHSNIPPCCVIYHCNTWRNYSIADKKYFNRLQGDPVDVQYVRCPRCIKKNRVETLHLCTKEEGDQFMEDFHRAWFPPISKKRKKKLQKINQKRAKRIDKLKREHKEPRNV